MLSRWSRAIAQISKVGSQGKIKGFVNAENALFSHNYAKVAAVSMPSSVDSFGKGFDNTSVATVRHSHMH